ncbi:hypothetical protein ACFRAE_06825 [Sphingobacterium sp. HJSM2_6]|uniref:hypothetical protein n=1 Tax=Sphingobacterium sp. HJSM2_6 TaxID=3366264 RepID=UPI003BD8A3AD
MHSTLYWLLILLLFLSCAKMEEQVPAIQISIDSTVRPVKLLEKYNIPPTKINIHTQANANFPKFNYSQYIFDLSGVNNSYCHPDVLYFPEGFQGYEYWMVFTPYFGKVGQDYFSKRYENPSIVVSHDGLTWDNPPALRNPIQACPSVKESFREMKGESIQGFWSDVDWIFRNDELELYYRGSCILQQALMKRGAKSLNNRKKLSQKNAIRNIVRQTSTDGVNWTALEVAFTSNFPSTPKDNHLISPSFIEVNGDVVAYEVEFDWQTKRYGSFEKTHVIQRHSKNGLDFSPFKECKQVNFVNAPWRENENLGIWHLNVCYVSGYYFMTLSVGRIAKYTSDLLYLAYSKDGLNFYVDPKPVMTENAYRSAIFPMKVLNDQITFGGIWGNKLGEFYYSTWDVNLPNLSNNSFLPKSN